MGKLFAKKKRLLVLMAVFVMLFCLSACGAKQAPAVASETEETEAAQTAPETQIQTEPEQKYETKTVDLCVSSVSTDYLLGSVTVTTNGYDEFGNLIRISREDESGALRDRKEYAYDEKGNRTALYVYNAENALEYRMIYQYDENGNVTMRCEFDSEDTLKNQSVLTYDEGGNLLSEVCTDADGNVIYQETNTYDAAGYRIENVMAYSISSDSSLYSVHTAYEYNENHTQEAVYSVTEETRVLVGKNNYDESGRMLSASEYEGGKCTSEICYTYDEEGKLLREECTTPAPRSGNSHEVLYTYDAQGNLLSITTNTFIDGQNYGSQTENTYETREIRIPVS